MFLFIDDDDDDDDLLSSINTVSREKNPTCFLRNFIKKMDFKADFFLLYLGINVTTRNAMNLIHLA